jgi:transcriptional regulator with XRE-family HTH domain
MKKADLVLGHRITELRKQKGWSQTELANKIGVSYPQMSRYELKGVQPPADILKKLADALNTTVDFLINGATDEKAKANLKDSELLNQFKAVEAMTDKDKNVIKLLIDAFITKQQIKKLAI